MLPVGAFLAIAALRLSGVYLALITLAFGVLMQYLVYPTSIAFGGGTAISVSSASIFGYELSSGRSFFIFTICIVALGVLLVEHLIGPRMGRIVRASADSPRALQSLGVGTYTSRILVFAISAGLAAVAGGLLVTLVGSVTPESYDWFNSLSLSPS